MGERWSATAPSQEPQRSRHIADYIAGMTDRFAIAAYARIYGSHPRRLEQCLIAFRGLLFDFCTAT